MRRDLRLIVLIREDLLMQLQRQHFLLSYFKNLSVGPAGVELTTSRMTTRCSINWATGARCWAVCGSMVNFSFCLFSALVPRVFPHCVQHFLHISTHFRIRDFRAEHWKRSVAKSASTLQVQSIRRKELAFSLLVSFDWDYFSFDEFSHFYSQRPGQELSIVVDWVLLLDRFW